MAVAVVSLGSLARNLGLLPTALLQIGLGAVIYTSVVYIFSRETVSVLRAMIGGHRPVGTVSA
jgi:hypothetical protein